MENHSIKTIKVSNPRLSLFALAMKQKKKMYEGAGPSEFHRIMVEMQFIYRNLRIKLVVVKICGKSAKHGKYQNMQLTKDFYGIYNAVVIIAVAIMHLTSFCVCTATYIHNCHIQTAVQSMFTISACQRVQSVLLSHRTSNVGIVVRLCQLICV